MNKSLVSKTTLIVGTLFAIPSLYGAESVYQVKRGDSLSKIAMDFSKNYSTLHWTNGLELIKELNAEKFENYDQIAVGDSVRLPDEDYVHTYLEGIKSSRKVSKHTHQPKRKTFDPQSNLVKNITSDGIAPLKFLKETKKREVAQNTVKVQVKKPKSFTINDAKDLDIQETKKVSAPVVAKIKKSEKAHASSSADQVKTYFIRKGDTLSQIALRYFGSKKLYNLAAGPMKKIMDANPSIQDPNLILAGSEIILPSRQVAEAKSPVNLNIEEMRAPKNQNDEIYWSKKERESSLNPDFSFLDFTQTKGVNFINGTKEGLNFKMS